MKTKPTSERPQSKTQVKPSHISPRWEHFLKYYDLKIRNQTKTGA